MDITTPSILIINGICGSGKSYVIKYIMYMMQNKLDYGLVFTNTSFDDQNYDFIADRDYIHPQYDEEKLHNLMKIQEQQTKEDRHPAFVIFDDCLYDPQQWSSRYLRRLLTTYRHYNIFIIISTQYPNHVPLNVRSLATQILIFSGFQNKKALLALFESYGQMYENFDKFKTIIMKLPRYTFMFINRQNGTKIEFMRAPENIPDYELDY